MTDSGKEFHDRTHRLSEPLDHEDPAGDDAKKLPWNWLSKVASSLSSIVNRSHDVLQGITENNHHNKTHNLIGPEHSGQLTISKLSDGPDGAFLRANPSTGVPEWYEYPASFDKREEYSWEEAEDLVGSGWVKVAYIIWPGNIAQALSGIKVVADVDRGTYPTAVGEVRVTQDGGLIGTATGITQTPGNGIIKNMTLSGSPGNSPKVWIIWVRTDGSTPSAIVGARALEVYYVI